jgi:hypothetical protein
MGEQRRERPFRTPSAVIWYVVIVFLLIVLGATLYSLWEVIETVNLMYRKLEAIHDYTLIK